MNRARFGGFSAALPKASNNGSASETPEALRNVRRFNSFRDIRLGGLLSSEDIALNDCTNHPTDAVAIGALQGTRGGMFEDASIKFNIVLLPYLVEGWDQALCLVRSPWMMEIAAEGRAKGFHIPAVGISQGFRAHGSKKRAIRTVEPMKTVSAHRVGASRGSSGSN